jgi:hypothetical protein
MANTVKQTITITEALSTLKLLDKKIEKKLEVYGNTINSPIDYRIGNSTKGELTLKDIKELKIHAEAGLQSIESLLKNRRALKAKIAYSNAITFVTIGENDDKITIVECIEYKNSIHQDKTLLARLERLYTTVINNFQEESQDAKERITSLINSKLGSENSSGNDNSSEILAKELGSIYNPELMDPINLGEYIEKLRNKIERFETDVDVVLSISNASTFIEV